MPTLLRNLAVLFFLGLVPHTLAQTPTYTLAQTPTLEQVSAFETHRDSLKARAGGTPDVSFVLTAPSRGAAAVVRSTPLGGDWGDPATWADGRVPTVDDDVVIAGGAVVEVRAAGQQDGRSLLIEEGATLQGHMNALLGIREGGVDNRGVVRSAPEFASGQFFILGTLGPFLNTGAVRYDDGPWIEFELYADVRDEGVWEFSEVEILGTDNRTLDLAEAEARVLIAGERVGLVGANRLALFELWDDGFLDLAWDASLELTGEVSPFLYEWLGVAALRGEVRWAFESSFVSLHDATVEVATGATLLDMTSHGLRVPSSFGSAVTRWWRLDAADEDARLSAIELRYASFDLQGNDPDALTVYHSADGGQTWTDLGAGADVSRFFWAAGELLESDYGTGSVRIQGDLPASGDFVLSSQPQTAARAALYFRIDGRDQIRVGGPPQRHIVHYGNLSDVPLGYGLLRLDTEGGVFIEEIISSSPGGSAPAPWDAEVFSPTDDSTYALLRTPPLAPGESRSFVAVLSAVPVDDGGGRSAAPAIGGAVVAGLAFSYLKDLMLSTGGEWLADPCGPLTGPGGAFDRGMDNTSAQYNPFSSEKPWQTGAENAATAMNADGVLARAAGPLGVANDMVSVADAVTKGARRYEATYGDGSLYQPIDCGPNTPSRPSPGSPERASGNWPLDPLRSWDPNAKVGPSGVGSQNFVAEGGRFTYQILFENKAEATAPAFRVVITDTLSEAFDLSTVERVGESHPGFTLTQEGRVLRWEIEGIELPPNQNPPEGEGYVEFTVETAEGLPTGTRVENRASIVFDLNEQIITNTHVNVIDFEGPTTVMTPLPPSTMGETVEVRFDSDDGDSGSGVASVAVYASKDGGVFYQAGVTEGRTFDVAVEPGHQYRFYALSQDHVGNPERVRPALVETAVVVSTDETTPPTFALAPNFPNPFSRATRLAFSLPEAAPTELVVFDVLGRVVSRLVDGPMSAGTHEVSWTTERAASGIYFYRLSQGERTASGRMVVVR